MKESNESKKEPKQLKEQCYACKITDVRIYRGDYGCFRNKKLDRCNKCLKTTAWYVPCVNNENGETWGFGSVPPLDVIRFYNTPEADTSPDAPTWGKRGWVNCVASDKLITKKELYEKSLKKEPFWLKYCVLKDCVMDDTDIEQKIINYNLENDILKIMLEKEYVISITNFKDEDLLEIKGSFDEKLQSVIEVEIKNLQKDL